MPDQYLTCAVMQPARDATIGIPKIEAGTARITGEVISPKEKIGDSSFVKFFVPHPISGKVSEYKTPIDPSGSFSIDIDLETDISLIALYTSQKPYNALLVKVRSGSETDMEITYGQNTEIEDVQTKPKMSKHDIAADMVSIK